MRQKWPGNPGAPQNPFPGCGYTEALSWPGNPGAPQNPSTSPETHARRHTEKS